MLPISLFERHAAAGEPPTQRDYAMVSSAERAESQNAGVRGYRSAQKLPRAGTSLSGQGRSFGHGGAGNRARSCQRRYRKAAPAAGVGHHSRRSIRRKVVRQHDVGQIYFKFVLPFRAEQHSARVRVVIRCPDLEQSCGIPRQGVGIFVIASMNAGYDAHRAADGTSGRRAGNAERRGPASSTKPAHTERIAPQDPPAI